MYSSCHRVRDKDVQQIRQYKNKRYLKQDRCLKAEPMVIDDQVMLAFLEFLHAVGNSVASTCDEGHDDKASCNH